MSYRLPLLRPAGLADGGMPPLRGQEALRIAAVQERTRAVAAPVERRFDPATDAALTRPLAPICGLSLVRPRLMGILNLTPDSFSDGGRLSTVSTAVAQAKVLLQDGADILDIGGESTRPGATEVPVGEEILRTAPVIAAMRAAGITEPISIDTRKAAVARAALAEGANIVNDVSGLTWDREMAPLIAETDVPVVLMHAQGTPQTMQENPQYQDVVLDVYDWLRAARDRAVTAGIAPERIILDAGLGFGKTIEHNLALMRALAIYHDLGCAMLLGASRKRFIGSISGVQEARARVAGSVAVALQGAAQGMQILRVHDVAQTRQALRMWQRMQAIDNGTEA